MKKTREVVWGCLGWEGWVLVQRGHRLAGVTFIFVLQGRKAGGGKKKWQHVFCRYLILLWLPNLSFSVHLDKATDSDNSLSSPPDLYYGCEILCARDK